ncbi:MAG: RidA family protein [Chroococcus sp. CMT-3BRIN-NPC107]|jgi:enamine deaminase RidA (YjgF/YER057c/UK114 family)|nr:RidA family protein [Chroococcus sp. CMT-3BRIN-NPC107]
MKRYINQGFIKLSRWFLLAIGVSFLLLNVAGVDVQAAIGVGAPRSVTRYGTSTSAILSAVAVPENQAYFWTSGTVPPVIDPNADTGTRDRYGDTKTQATGILTRFQTLLAEGGLSLEDVVYLRVYLVADPVLGSVDYQGWFDAYAQFFNKDNVPKVARSTLAVAGLVDPGWLVEIEAVAVYPKKGRG